MKMLQAGIIICLLTSMAFAVPVFEINGGAPILTVPGVPITVPITVSGARDIAGMRLNLQISSPLQIVDLVVDADGSGTIFEENTSGADMFHQYKPLPDGTLVPSFLGIGSVTTDSGMLKAKRGLVALVTILEPARAPTGAVGFITTGSEALGISDMLVPSGDGIGCGQGWAAIVTGVPEPVSSLLLLAGLPFVRRHRRA